MHDLLGDSKSSWSLIGSSDAKSKCNSVVALPTKLVGDYSIDYDILKADSIVKEKLHAEHDAPLKVIRDKIAILTGRLSADQPYITYRDTEKQIANLEREAEAITSGSRLNQYIRDTTPLLDEYKLCHRAVKVIVFGAASHEEPDEADCRRIALIKSYLEVAAKYIDVQVKYSAKRIDRVCVYCEKPFHKLPVADSSAQYCPHCWAEHPTVLTVKLAKDSTRLSSNSLGDDESIENFLRAFDRYQGIQSETPPRELYTKLDEYFTERGRPTSKDISALPLTSRGEKTGTNLRMLLAALCKISCPVYYEHVNYIAHVYWGWRLPVVAQYREKIISHYNKTQYVYLLIPVDRRRRWSSLGTQYRLWRHLQLVGHCCEMSDFKIADNPDSLSNHHRLWKMMCEGANDPEIYYIP
jgi:hypothetical protein